MSTPSHPLLSRVRRAGSPATAGTAVTHGWIPAGERWLAVDVHEPAAPSRGATVVVAAPPGRERATMNRTVVHTARALAADGWRVVRFDWSGTNQSPTLEVACDAQLWAADLRAVREWAGAGEPVHGVGFSVAGAFMAADEDSGWVQRVLMAPVSGKQWLRHQSALRRMAGSDLPPRVTDGTELMDLQLSAEGAAELKRLSAPADDVRRGIRVLSEESTGPLPLDVHPRVATVPDGLLPAVLAALGEHAPTRGAAGHDDAAWPRPAQQLTVDVHGVPVRLVRTVSGRENRPAVLAEPVRRAAHAPGLALMSPGSDVMEGEGGFWLRTELLAAAAGAVCLMAERTDTGELVHPERTRNSNPYARLTVAECRELVEHLARLTDGPLAAAGICLSAWGLVAAAPKLSREVAGRLSLYAINSVAWQGEPWRYWRQGVRSGPLAPRMPGEGAPAPAQDTETEPSGAEATAAVSAGDRARALARTVVSRGGDVARAVVRGTRTRAHEASPRINSLAASLGIIDVPQPALRRLARVPGLRVTAVFGPADAAYAHVTKAHRDGRSAVVLLDPLDHSVFATASRDTLTRYMVDEVTGLAAAGR
ncbi:hypothetical protein [Kocuria sp.]|uniref:hypothetical protein n=1 Tax=Kocuria sp. TaxID=1871328 RepID=UPI0026DDA508|nr:hypothetical protein [Kocuria sp.]MDO4919828.1 hypothetical protein [Kocuria sp.]